MPSELQNEYRDFFTEMMEKHKVDNIEDLSEEKLKTFFDAIEDGWEEGKGRTSSDLSSRLEHVAFRLTLALSPLQEEYRDYLWS